MFRDQPSQILALVRSRELKNTKLINIGGRPVIVSKSTTPSIRLPRGESIKLALAFAAIYLVWGSTYLAIRYAVETIPPLVAGRHSPHDRWRSPARMGIRARVSPATRALDRGHRTRRALLSCRTWHAALGGTARRVRIGRTADRDRADVHPGPRVGERAADESAGSARWAWLLA